MSSTNRKNKRQDNDYYVTPVKEITKFWTEFMLHNDVKKIRKVLDPATGGARSSS